MIHRVKGFPGRNTISKDTEARENMVGLEKGKKDEAIEVLGAHRDKK